jgi:hypothetical protein
VAPDDIDAYEAALRQPPEARSPAQRLKVPSLATTPSHLHVARPLMTAAANQLGSVEQIVVLVAREPVVCPHVGVVPQKLLAGDTDTVIPDDDVNACTANDRCNDGNQTGSAPEHHV